MLKEKIVELDNVTIKINFSKLFNRNLDQYSDFFIRKRSYHKYLGDLNKTIEEYIEEKECLDYAYNLLYFKFKVNSDFDLNIENVINFIKEKFFKDEKLIELIKKDIEKDYNLKLDDSVNKNENLQVTDDLNKKYLCSSLMMRLLLPLVSTISDKVPDNEELDKYIFEINTEIILFFNDNDENSLKKIHNIVSSRILQTIYSDKDVWEFLKKQTKDILLTIRQFYYYIIINSYIKIEKGTSSISYIDVILKNKVRFLFKLNYKVSHKTLDYNVSKGSDDALTDIEKLELSLLRKDKGISFINKMSVKMEVDRIKNKYKDDENLDIFKEIVGINRFTKTFLNIYYKKIDISFDAANIDNVYYLLYDMLDDLRRRGFELIPEIIIAKDNNIRSINKRSIKDKLNGSIKFKLLLNKYKDIENLVSDDKNFITDLLISLKSKKFLNINEEEIQLDLDKLKEEVLDFLYI